MNRNIEVYVYEKKKCKFEINYTTIRFQILNLCSANHLSAFLNPNIVAQNYTPNFIVAMSIYHIMKSTSINMN